MQGIAFFSACKAISDAQIQCKVDLAVDKISTVLGFVCCRALAPLQLGGTNMRSLAEA